MSSTCRTADIAPSSVNPSKPEKPARELVVSL